jgi:hypothetical protein
VRPSSLLAVAISALAGVALGIGAGVAVGDHGPTTFADPLGLNVPLRNQPVCDGTVLLTVDRGPTASQIATGVTENLHDGVSYLDTKRSCPTAWVQRGRVPPRYVAYVGPFDSRGDACDAQFTAGHRGGIVTTLLRGTTDPVQCLCFVQLARPLLRTGMANDGTDGIWIRQLQGLLVDLGRATDENVTGAYDETTAAKIRDFQRDNRRPATGEVDPETWHFLQTEACKL